MPLLALYMIAIIGTVHFGGKMATKGGDGWSLLFATTAAISVVTALLARAEPMLLVVATLVAIATYAAVAITATTMRRQQQ